MMLRLLPCETHTCQLQRRQALLGAPIPTELSVDSQDFGGPATILKEFWNEDS
jgi:hypothetical protein